MPVKCHVEIQSAIAEKTAKKTWGYIFRALCSLYADLRG